MTIGEAEADRHLLETATAARDVSTLCREFSADLHRSSRSRTTLRRENSAMRFVTSSLAGLIAGLSLCAAPFAAQNLSNGDFENGPPGGLGAWGWNWPTPTAPATFLSKTANPGDVYCGDWSLKLSPTSNYREFGKYWSAPPVGAQLHAVARVRATSTDPSSMVRLVAQEYSSGGGVGGSDEVTLPLDGEWHELSVSFTVPGNDLRFGLILNDMRGQHLFVDYVTFTGSSTSLNGGAYPDQEVVSSEMSLLLNGSTGDIRHLRWYEGEASVLGENLLDPSEATELCRVTLDTGGRAIGSGSGGGGPTSITPLSSGIRVVRAMSDVTIAVNVEVDDNDDPSTLGTEELLLLTPEVTLNDSFSRELRSIEVAALKTSPELGTGLEDDFYFLPSADGSVASPHLFLSAGGASDLMQESREYPGSASMQFLAFYDDNVGLTLWSRDSEGESKTFGYQYDRSSGKGRLGITHLTPWTEDLDVPAQDVCESVPIVIERCSGSWMDAARRYRQWALGQPWANSTAHPLPSWVEKRPLAVEADLQVQGIGVPLVPMALGTEWRDLLDAWQSEVAGAMSPAPSSDIPMLPIFRAFEKHGVFITGPNMTPFSVHDTTWLGTDYGLLYNDHDIATSWLTAKAAGHVPMAMVAALKWARTRDQHTFLTVDPVGPVLPDPCPDSVAWWVPAFDPSNNGWFGSPGGDAVCVTNPNGQTVINMPEAKWDFEHGRMCPAVPYVRDLFRDLGVYAATRGILLYQLDQMNGGKTPSCHNVAHGHPEGDGRWRYESVKQMLEDILLGVPAGITDFGLAMEDPSELFIPQMALMGVRPGNLTGWPATASGVKGQHQTVVPAFQFLYSSRQESFTWDLPIFSYDELVGGPSDERSWDLLRLGKTFVSGTLMVAQIRPWTLFASNAIPCGAAGLPTCSTPPSLFAPNIVPEPCRASAQATAFLTRAALLGHTGARPYFNEGEMVGFAGHSVPTGTLATPEDGPIDYDKVQLSAWRRANGRVGIVIGNIDYLSVPGPANDLGVTHTIDLPDTIDGEPVPAGAVGTVWLPGPMQIHVDYADLRSGFTIDPFDAVLVEILYP
jgi:hypothetical protein